MSHFSAQNPAVAFHFSQCKSQSPYKVHEGLDYLTSHGPPTAHLSSDLISHCSRPSLTSSAPFISHSVLATQVFQCCLRTAWCALSPNGHLANALTFSKSSHKCHLHAVSPDHAIETSSPHSPVHRSLCPPYLAFTVFFHSTCYLLTLYLACRFFPH